MKRIEKFSRHWWLTYAILATQEAEIRKIMVQTGLPLKINNPYANYYFSSDDI
jgi:hypothetical protein